MRILSRDAFIKAHHDFDQMLRNYATTARGMRALNAETLQRCKHSSAASMYAANMLSRTEFGCAAGDVFRDQFAARSDEPFFFISLTPREFARPVSEAGTFDVESLKKWTDNQLSGHRYVAIVEAAYCGNFNAVPGYKEPMISWHAHAIVWGTPDGVITTLVDRINRAYEPLVPGRLCAHKRRFRYSGAISRLFYMLKAPFKEYRVIRRKTEFFDPETGEVTNTFGQKKRPLRKGDAAKMTSIMGGRTLGDLTFGRGEGHELWRNILSSASQRLRDAHEARQRELLALY